MKPKSFVFYALALLLLPLLVGALRAHDFLARRPAPLVAASFAPPPAPKPHDPARPTVAIVLGADLTEITDMLGPYEMFARSGRYNVYSVAPAAASTSLTGGLRVRPHHSFKSLDALLEGRAPDIVVAPNLPNITAPENRPVVEWVRQSSSRGATSLAWCAGAAVLAEAGLLDGHTATSHWGDLKRLEHEYPRVLWQRGVRWIDHGSIVTSAGITSGIDATLRLLIRLQGQDVARRVARELNYPNYHFALQPEAEQYTPGWADAVLFLNAAFRPRQQIGLGLYTGVGELDVSTLYDAHAAAGIAEVRAVATGTGLVSTAHGLWLEPALAVERDGRAVAELDRVIVPGRNARKSSSALETSLAAAGSSAPEYLHADGTARFSLEPTLEDLAEHSDQSTVRFAARRLEYRSEKLAPADSPLSPEVFLMPLALGLVGVVLVRAARRSPRPHLRSTPWRLGLG